MTVGCDWSGFGGVLLLLLRLATIGAQGPSVTLGQACGPTLGTCDVALNIVCDDETSTCVCAPGRVPFSRDSCDVPPGFGGTCGATNGLPRCGIDDTTLLTCVGGTCACVDGYDYLPTFANCFAQTRLGQRCDTPRDPQCRSGADWNLQCMGNVCECTVGTFPQANGEKCGRRAHFGEACDNPPCQVGPGWNLRCLGNVCQCTAGTVLQANGERCDRKAHFGEECDNPICQGTGPGDTDGSSWNLWCNPATRRCECTDSDPAVMVNYPDGWCREPPTFGKPCGSALPACKSGANLKCDMGRCACADANWVEHPDKRCGPPTPLHEGCTQIACHPDPELHMECSGGTCKCTAGNVEHPRFVCGPPAQLHQTCDLPVCATGDRWNLLCENRKCMCNPSHLEEIPAEGRCAFPAQLHQDCGPPTCETGTDWNLLCDAGSRRCVCKDDTVVEHLGFKCGPPARFGQSCLPFPACLTAGNLECSTATSKCVCLPNFYERADLTCGTAAKHGEDCTEQLPCIPDAMLECRQGKCACVGARIPAADLRSCHVPEPSKHRESCDPKAGFRCKSGVNLVCNDQLVCVCSMRWMVADGGESGGCKLRDKSKRKEECELEEDCDVRLNLQCNTLIHLCVCIRLHAPDPLDDKRCRRALSRYDEPCDHDAHCLQNHNMVCDPKGVCLCVAGWDLDHGVTPCKESKFGGRTYGEPCENFPVERKCVVAHNIHCVAGLCACLDEYVLNEDTRKDPAIGVSTCRPGDGGADYNGDCEVNAITIKTRCNTRQGLACEITNKLCACAPGYIPTLNEDPGSEPCKPGERVHGESCDPPEFLVRPRPIDPITGVPYPGPTSPPPPKFACDISKNFECFKGKCACKDETVSDRYRLEPKSGSCLITAGYDCTKNEECFSGRCITKAEAAKESGDRGPSHDHGEKLCAGSPTGKSGGNAQIQNGFLVVATTSASSLLFNKCLRGL